MRAGPRATVGQHDIAPLVADDTPRQRQLEVSAAGIAIIRQLIAVFNAMRDRLVATLAEKDRMLGAIVHDLRTPLVSAASFITR